MKPIEALIQLAKIAYIATKIGVVLLASAIVSVFFFLVLKGAFQAILYSGYLTSLIDSAANHAGISAILVSIVAALTLDGKAKDVAKDLFNDLTDN